MGDAKGRLSEEAELARIMRKGKPEGREEAIKALALMMATGRVKAPSVVSTERKDDGISAF